VSVQARTVQVAGSTPAWATRRYAIELAVAALGYFGLAVLGLELASAAPQVSVVWPASGAALALLLFRGRRLWPAIVAGAFAANLATGAPLAAAATIAGGNALEAVLGATLAARFGLNPDLRRLRDVVLLFALIALLSPVPSATIGVTTLCLAGLQVWQDFKVLWTAWWFGDALGILIVSPFLFTWAAQVKRGLHFERWQEILAIILALGVLGLAVFSQSSAVYPVHYLIFPAVIWSALRLGQTATATVAFAAACVTTAATLLGRGPFVSESGHVSLINEELFVAVVAVTGLVLGAVMSERNRAQRARLAETSHAAEQLAREDRRKDEFLAVLAHELRNPLAPLQNALALLARGGGDPARLAQTRAIMERQLKHLVRLVDDLLDVSRIRSGKILLARERLDLARVVQDAVEMSQPLIVARKHLLSVQLPDEPLTLVADPTRLPQLIANLLNNAAKYTPDGGRITLTAVSQDAEVTLRVRDSGIGMTREALAAVFELFAQARSAHTIEGGLGVGLSVARALAALHGGTLEAHSDGPGRGSEFVLRLPLTHDTGIHAEDSIAEPAEPLAMPSKVIIVDDNADAADTLVELLRHTGYEARAAYDGAGALDAARRWKPDVMVLDLGMPGMDGYQLAEAVRNDPDLMGTRLVALSGYGQDEDRRRARAAGFDAHLVKPVDIEVLDAALRPRRQ
jgi:signal transduction histidine kinase